MLATTHFQGVKAFALSAEHARVAAVDFDPETFAPRSMSIAPSSSPSSRWSRGSKPSAAKNLSHAERSAPLLNAP